MRLSPVLGLGFLALACAPKAETPAPPAGPVALSAAELDAVKSVDAAFSVAMNARDTSAIYAV